MMPKRMNDVPNNRLLKQLLFAGLSLPALMLCAALAPVNKTYPQMRLHEGALLPIEPYSPEPATGLQKPFPPILMRADNPTTPERVELGKLLFFDPVLSGDNTMSCAHCHHPDLGFSDAQPRSRGKGSNGVGSRRQGGVELTRAAPSLWNAFYYHRQFWDGRARDLEDQARFPITDANEMNQNPDELVRELKAIPEYRELFDKAFGGSNGSAVTFVNVQYAIAAFERTLVSLRSRFDRYAAGEGSALNASEKNGLKLFLSPKTRCNECHGIPTFANRDFKVIGVPHPENGPADVHKPEADPDKGGGPNGAFKIPTLRNVALTAPYMHTGEFKTLEEVLDFYSNGGGRGRGLDVPLQDDKIRKFVLTEKEKSDMVAFLLTLTDESAKPKIPRRVPSGLPVVGRAKPLPPTKLKGIVQMKSFDARANHGVSPSVSPKPSDSRLSASALTRFAEKSGQPGRIVTVRPGQSIQDAVDKAGKNGKVRILPGTYHENVLVIQHGITIEGVIESGKRPLLDGKNVLADAFSGLGHNFTISGLEIRNYQGNGVVVHNAKNVVFRDLEIHNTGLYGVYPVECDGILVEKCRVSGIRDAGIYVGQSKNIIVRDNEAFQNVAGIEIENSENAIVENNYVHNNTGGILVFLLPFNPSKVATNTVVRNNRVINNNTPNFGDPGAIVTNIPAGAGIIVMAADKTEVTGNEIIGNNSFGIAVNHLNIIFPPNTKYDVDPSPDENYFHKNILKDNGKNPHESLKKLGLNGSDIIWDMTGKNNVWDQPGASSFPPSLPGKRVNESEAK